MMVSKVTERIVPKVFSSFGIMHPKSTAFDRTVRSIATVNRVVEPYLFQTGNIPRIPGRGFYAYRIVPLDSSHSSQTVLTEENFNATKLLQFVNKCIEGAYRDANDYIYLFDGEAYSASTISSLPNYDRIFVLFEPYDPKITVPLAEAKRHIGQQ